MESVFSNVPGCKVHTWLRVVSTTQASLEIQRSFLEHFRTVVSITQPDHFSHAFARHHAFLGVFAFHYFCVGVYFSFHHCLKGKFNF